MGCSKNSCEKQDDEHFWTGGCSCGCPGKEVGKYCPEKPPHLEEDVDAVAHVVAQPALSGELRSDDDDDDDDDVPTGCGCYEMAKHKCVCDEKVCSKSGCLLHFGIWTGGCSSCM